MEQAEDRVAVVASARSYGVTIAFGDTLITVRGPRPASDAQISEEQVCSAALRSARRALEAALTRSGSTVAEALGAPR